MRKFVAAPVPAASLGARAESAISPASIASAPGQRSSTAVLRAVAAPSPSGSGTTGQHLRQSSGNLAAHRSVSMSVENTDGTSMAVSKDLSMRAREKQRDNGQSSDSPLRQSGLVASGIDSSLQCQKIESKRKLRQQRCNLLATMLDELKGILKHTSEEDSDLVVLTNKHALVSLNLEKRHVAIKAVMTRLAASPELSETILQQLSNKLARAIRDLRMDEKREADLETEMLALERRIKQAEQEYDRAEALLPDDAMEDVDAESEWYKPLFDNMSRQETLIDEELAQMGFYSDADPSALRMSSSSERGGRRPHPASSEVSGPSSRISRPDPEPSAVPDKAHTPDHQPTARVCQQPISAPKPVSADLTKDMPLDFFEDDGLSSDVELRPAPRRAVAAARVPAKRPASPHAEPDIGTKRIPLVSLSNKALPVISLSKSVSSASVRPTKVTSLPPAPVQAAIAPGVKSTTVRATVSRNDMSFPWSRDVLKVLNKHFRLSSFRPNQLKAINATLAADDVFILMPTGGGKSLCYQLPAVVQSGKTRGVSIVISPLLSLIHDQCQALMDKDVIALAFNSDLKKSDRDFVINELRTADDDTRPCLIYVTPEMIAKSTLFKDVLRNLHRRQRLARFVIDEAHCISSWGFDFRPDYKELGSIKREYPGVPIMALTATANERVKQDVITSLGINDCLVLSQSFNRPNLRYEVRPKGKLIIKDISDLIKRDFAGLCGIIYCLSKKQCEDIAEALKTQHGVKAHHYHAGMAKDDRIRIQADWQRGKIHVVCATIAFGMGIDKANVRFVLHFTISGSLEAYYQETGRAGRDGGDSVCILYFNFNDTRLLYRLIDTGEGSHEQKQRQRAHVQDMVKYAFNTIDCRRTQVLQYFGETFAREQCHATCDNCRKSGTGQELVNMTSYAKLIITLVREIQDQKGITLVHCADIFRGSKLKKVVESGHDRLAGFGAGSSLARTDIERLLQIMCNEGILGERHETNGMGFTSAYCILGKHHREVLNGHRTVNLICSSANAATKGAKAPRKSIEEQEIEQGFWDNDSSPVAARQQAPAKVVYDLEDDDEEDAETQLALLESTQSHNARSMAPDTPYDQFCRLRRDQAIKANVDAKQICSDALLAQITARLPDSADALSKTPGITQDFVMEYGRDYVALCRGFRRKPSSAAVMPAPKKASGPNKTKRDTSKKAQKSMSDVAKAFTRTPAQDAQKKPTSKPATSLTKAMPMRRA
ncbi:uncharacterized protein L969DRAFT_23304 [Mixia osmundae IAM 14324]|uniref:DNA 3'-5' helicase n=1 Tax=Mixia osmundae (strain CBS 9802 / IAM 14324 / JCM 22182 / KY 12970) TaxID=764103 RepID=G7E9W7_MIXOS|nr:uncharacterized protein L969DRAFT_23304 [Mixia osmundae IAM 14324]KEI40070.1 hypothetical protein L969DRAFT_23304 [Mixia osmundae IAM 14324]GAA99436.1 hypothetical protein E5Q_06135 [Mixia osmundae IAM 14324]